MAAQFATAALVRTLAPEFSAASTDQIDPFLRLAKNLVSVARFGDETDDAHALATAHYMKMDPGLNEALGTTAASVGQVASKSHGPASVTYVTSTASANESPSEAWLSASSYGQAFKVIRDRKRGRGSAVRIGNSRAQRS